MIMKKTANAKWYGTCRHCSAFLKVILSGSMEEGDTKSVSCACGEKTKVYREDSDMAVHLKAQADAESRRT